MERRKSIYMITTPAGDTGSYVETKKIQDRIASRLSRLLMKHPDWTADLLIGVSDVSPKGGQYVTLPTGTVGRPGKIFLSNTTIEGQYYHRSPHIHILMVAYPGETLLKAIKDILDKSIHINPATPERIDYKRIAVEFEAENYIIKQSKNLRVVQSGDPSILGNQAFRFSKYGRGKARR